MRTLNKISHQLDALRKRELCPSICNLQVEKYSFSFLMNDMLCGVKLFLILLPIVTALAFFCGTSPIQGVISCGLASICSIIIGGSRYQISSIAIPLCVVMFEITTKYQYKGLLYVAIFTSVLLIIFGVLRFSDVLKHISGAYLAAIVIFVSLSIIIDQLQYILNISTIKSSQSLLDNWKLLYSSFHKIAWADFSKALLFIAPLILIRTKIKGSLSFAIYLGLGAMYILIGNQGFLPNNFTVDTVGASFINAQLVDNIMSISKNLPSQTFLMNMLNYAFAISLVIATEVCFCTNVAASVTGDKKLQLNAELISSGVANFLSVACGGMLVSPSIDFTMKNISYKAKTIIGLFLISVLCLMTIKYAGIILNYIPVYCLSSILILFAFSLMANKKPLQYFNLNHESYIFIATMLALLYFGFIPAVIIGFTVSIIFFSKRMIKIKDATVHTTKNHDSGAIEFMANKNGFSKNFGIPKHILDQIEVIQVNNILFLNIAKLVEEGLTARGFFPKVLIIYFKNIPFLDGEALTSLKYLVQEAKHHNCMVIVSGTNGMLLDILKQKEREENTGQIFGYIVPNFKEAVLKTTQTLK